MPTNSIGIMNIHKKVNKLSFFLIRARKMCSISTISLWKWASHVVALLIPYGPKRDSTNFFKQNSNLIHTFTHGLIINRYTSSFSFSKYQLVFKIVAPKNIKSQTIISLFFCSESDRFHVCDVMLNIKKKVHLNAFYCKNRRNNKKFEKKKNQLNTYSYTQTDRQRTRYINNIKHSHNNIVQFQLVFKSEEQKTK